jgi:hypothetical protein
MLWDRVRGHWLRVRGGHVWGCELIRGRANLLLPGIVWSSRRLIRDSHLQRVKLSLELSDATLVIGGCILERGTSRNRTCRGRLESGDAILDLAEASAARVPLNH